MKKFNTLCESLINEVSDLSDKDFDLALIRILSSKAPTHTITWTVPNDKQLTNEYKTEYVAKGHTPKITLEQFIKLCKETKLKEILKHKTPDSIDNQMSRLKSLRRTMQCYRSWNNETYPGRDKVRGDENFLYLIKTLKDGNTTFDAPLWNQGDSIALFYVEI